MSWDAYVLPAAIATAFSFLLFYGQRWFGKKDKLDSSYVDARFAFSSRSEANLWAEIYSLRKDLALAREEYFVLLFTHIDLLIEHGKVDLVREARQMLRDKLEQVRKEETRKTTEVEQKLQQHQDKVSKVTRPSEGQSE
jgi:hypothetical protein